MRAGTLCQTDAPSALDGIQLDATETYEQRSLDVEFDGICDDPMQPQPFVGIFCEDGRDREEDDSDAGYDDFDDDEFDDDLDEDYDDDFDDDYDDDDDEEEDDDED